MSYVLVDWEVREGTFVLSVDVGRIRGLADYCVEDIY